MNRDYLLGLAFLAAMVVFLVLPNVNFFEESTKFAKPAGQNMVTVESDGTITLVPVKNIDTAINATVDSLKSELNTVITRNTSSITTNRQNAIKEFQPVGDYVKYADPLRVQALDDNGQRKSLVYRTDSEAGTQFVGNAATWGVQRFNNANRSNRIALQKPP